MDNPDIAGCAGLSGRTTEDIKHCLSDAPCRKLKGITEKQVV